MSVRVAVAVLSALLAAAVAWGQSSPNLISNGGFDRDLSGWTANYDPSLITIFWQQPDSGGSPVSGSMGLRGRLPFSDFSLHGGMRIPVQGMYPSFHISMDVRVFAGAVYGLMEWLDAAGHPVGSGGLYTIAAQTIPTSTWKTIQGNLAPPPGTASANLWIAIVATPGQLTPGADVDYVVLTGSGSATSPPSNLLVNGGFDGDLRGWTRAGTATFISATHDTRDVAGNAASGSALCTNQDTKSEPFSFYDVLYQEVPIVGGATYTLSAMVFSNFARAGAFVDWKDASGTTVPASTVYPTQPWANGERAWLASTLTMAAPATAVSARISLDVEVMPGSSAYFDNVSLAGPARPVGPVINAFTASPAAIAAGQSSTLSWSTTGATVVTIDNGIGAVPANGSIVVRPATTTTYTLTATSSGGGTTTVQTTITVASKPALAIAGYPNGITQLANSSGGVDRAAVTNVGGATATVTVSSASPFFTVSPTSFSLPAGGTQSVIISATAQPAGYFEGAVVFNDTANAGDTLTVTERLLSASPPSGSVTAQLTTPRVDISAAAGTSAQGTLTFKNSGTGTLQGIAVSDKAWMIPESGLISIAPGGARAVSFTIDPTKLAAAALGTQSATMSLTYVRGASGKRGAPADTPPSSASTGGTVNYTPSVPLTTGPIAPLGSTAAYAVPGLVHFPSTAGFGYILTDFVALNRSGSPLPATSLIYIPGSANAAATAVLDRIPPNVIIPYGDIVSRLFSIPQETPSVGALQIRSGDPANVALAVALTSPKVPTSAGTFLGSLKAMRTDRAIQPGGKTYLVGIRNDDIAITSLYIQEVSGSATTVRTDFLDNAGNVVSSRTDTIAASSQLALANPASPTGAVTAVITNTGAGSIVARALLRYLQTGDITDIIDWNAYSGTTATTQVIPYVTRRVQGSSVTTTELDIMNTSATTPLVATLEYRSATAVGRRRPVKSQVAAPDAVASITLGPQQSAAYPDVLSSAFGIGSVSSGSLVLTTSSGSAAVTAVVNDTVPGIGAFSTSLPVGPDSMSKGDSRQFAGIVDAAPSRVAAKDSNSYSTAFGLVETSGKPATVLVTVNYSAVGAVTSQPGSPQRTYVLPASGVLPLLDLRKEFFQGHENDYGDLNIRIDFQVTDGDGAVMPYVVSTENATGDRLVRSGRF